VSIIRALSSQVRATETGSGPKEMKECKRDMELDIREICGRMKYCTFERFKVLMTEVDMGTEVKRAVGSATQTINPFSNIYFYDKDNCSEAREMQWHDVPVFPVPE
jgi:hypothetical protein